jgi:DNA-binding transcriptional MerR regulator
VPMADDHDEEKQLLEPIEPAQLLRNLELTTGKAAEFAGVSRRQLCYWTDTGIVSALEGAEDDSGDSTARRTYDFDALHKVLLIKRALEHSAGLRRAAREVDQYLSERRRNADELGNSIEQKRDEFLTEQADKLEAVAAQIQQLAPDLNDRDQVSELYQALDWLDRLAERVQAGEVLLEEDAEACLRLASRIDQVEAKLEGVAASD